MRYVTRCPVCLALFEVRDAQRHAAQGWLRCGQCLTAFDSAGLVLPWPETSPAAVSSGEFDLERLDLDTLLHRQDASVGAMPTQASIPAPLAAGHAVVRPQSSPVRALPAESPVLPSVSASSTTDVRPSAVQSRREPAPTRPRLWWMGTLVALVVFALQGLYAFRGPLAMHTPVFEQLGQGTCRMLGCEWPALRHVQALQLDHARLLREGEVLVLSIRLRNLAPVTLSSGSLAITLSDPSGRTLARRVLSMQTLGAAPTLLAGAVWEGQAVLRVASPDDIAGFQVTLLGP